VAIGDDRYHLGRQGADGTGVEDRLEIRATAGHQHHES
jgi:hypothetical protein